MSEDFLARQIQENIKKSVQHKNQSNPDPFLRYIGGKQAIAKELLKWVPPHNIYCEPFLGSGAFFFKKHKAESNLLNDFNGDLVNLFLQVRDNLYSMLQWIWLTPLSEEMHRRIFKTYNSETWEKLSPLKRACGYYYMLQLAYNESVGNIGNPSYKISKGHQKWNQEICQEIFMCSKKLNNVIITRRSYVDLVNYDKLNTENTFWYFDPPYTMAGDKGYYKHNFLPSHHHEFMTMVKRLNGKIMISYDDHPMIREIFKDFNILKVPNFSNEIAILNYKPKSSQEAII